MARCRRARDGTHHYREDPDGERRCAYCSDPPPRSLFDTPRSAKGSETSAAAAHDIVPVREAQRERVLEAFRAAGDDGLTDLEGQERTGLLGSSYRPRRLELAEAHLVLDSGRTRRTPSGRRAAVWMLA